MAQKKSGLRIGHYRIKPLGIAALAVLVCAITAAVVLLTGGLPDTTNPQTVVSAQTPEPSAEPSETPEPTAVVTNAPTAVPTPTPTPAPRRATIRALGEIAMETDLLKSAYREADGSFDFGPMFSEIADLIGNADYTIADVEGTLGDTAGISGDGKTMNTPSSLLATLKDCGVDMLTLANDHALDGTFEELQATIANVTAAGLDYIGASASAEEHASPALRDINGIRVGFLAYTDSLNGNQSKLTSDQAYAINLSVNSDIAADVAAARNAGAEVVIAVVSWGEMLSRTPNKSEQEIAFALTQAGADVIIGYGPHVVQPIFWLETDAADGSGTNRTLCICATGNFLSNQRAQYADSGVIFQFTIAEQTDGTLKLEAPTYIPTYVWRFKSDESPDSYQYRVMAVGRWLANDGAANMPDGMSEKDYKRMTEVWSEIQGTMGGDTALISAD